ncbi:MAG: DUF2007 domain-containing protein [Bacteroidales bacterium]|nr:DUF2007 domain-containing protein [Bacteroidales bacterium]MBP5241835.1 DUF2007 domain-containing protein [Bacteroidales bacterium]MBP5758597.1 DUF2007 domain-containing protein [Bacteroidales bacterium]
MDWITVYTTGSDMEGAFVQGLLQNEGISAVVMDQSDSSYKFGDVKVMVPPENVMEANVIVKEYLENR